MRKNTGGRYDWMGDAACAGQDSKLWFPRRGDWRTGNKAKAICAACPVREDCLAMAMAEPWRYRGGIYGGLDPRERRSLARELGRAG